MRPGLSELVYDSKPEDKDYLLPKCVGRNWQKNGKCRRGRRIFWNRFYWTTIPADLDADGQVDDLIVPGLYCPKCSVLKRGALAAH